MSNKQFPPPDINAGLHTLTGRRSILLLPILLLLAFSIGCGPSSPQGNAARGQNGSNVSGDTPELDDETIRDRLYTTRVRDIPEENGAADPIGWSFFRDEPLEIRVVDRQMNGTSATLILDIKTGSSPGTRNPRELAGQVRTHWQLQTGWVLRRWEIVDTENISMKYKNLPKPPAANNSNQ
jgi:hypothetical protein